MAFKDIEGISGRGNIKEENVEKCPSWGIVDKALRVLFGPGARLCPERNTKASGFQNILSSRYKAIIEKGWSGTQHSSWNYLEPFV